MKIGLIDVDGHSNFPNLALMKISAWHKQQNHEVSFCDGLFGGKYDKVYMSKVFTESKHFEQVINCDDIIRGGTGYDLTTDLPAEVELMYPDYSIYNVSSAYGYLTRGCPRGCKFCIVGDKEGLKSVQVAELPNFWNGQKEIILLDPNLLACKTADKLLQDLINSKAWIDFTQGLDIRFMTDARAELLNQMKVKMIHFAWDNYEFKTYELLKKYRSKLNYSIKKLAVYVLTNFTTTHEQDLERVYKLKELKYDPYIMIYDKYNAPENTRKLQRWVNNKILFGAVDRFENVKQDRKLATKEYNKRKVMR
ncbi:MAG: hypothetical protein WC748_09800 [Legionellales bacterium]|jgi:hypothetical protein